MTRVAKLESGSLPASFSKLPEPSKESQRLGRSSVWLKFGSHLRTLSPHLIPVARGNAPRRNIRFSLEDPKRGQVWLSGTLRVPVGAEDLIVLVHGLGGNSESPYVRAAALAAEKLGIATFSISLRGADRLGEDFYNIALTADLHAAMACKELLAFKRIDLLGFSMGGHVALTYATEAGDSRVCSVAAICTPLDLKIEQLHFDRELHPLYRWHVLRGLKSIYAAVAKRRAVPSELHEVMAVKTVHDWDRLTIAPRYGYPTPEAYYDELSVGPKLGSLRMPALLIAGEVDPIVPTRAILNPLANLSQPPAHLDLHWVRSAGHVSLSRQFNLGLSANLGLVPQVSAWMRSRAKN
ncbi:MAG: putative alpha/beta-fold hydrolase [Planctomycetota bacterium]|jgi:predicted alpha/beta-fold hydrolase